MAEVVSHPTWTNRLANETSPYLLQHAHNPVDWYPWGPEALDRARREDRAILLSIGYSACHWCHVMERESFEDEATAALMNEHFVSIKVDREERPDLDSIYMQAVQAMTSHGGWPMTVFLTPAGAPFYGGTYYPPEDRHGMPSFKKVLAAIADAWTNRRSDILRGAENLRGHLQGIVELPPARGPLDSLVLDAAARGLASQHDDRLGGFGNAPKFPQPMATELLLRDWYRTSSPRAREVAVTALASMANGGIYDHLGGGFHRYSTDAAWLVPHFEKMLYDNAQLARVYLLGYLATGDQRFRRVAEETIDYVLRDLADPLGGFYSTEDADSEGEEGKFYVWTLAELQAVLGPRDAHRFAACYGVTEHGNFEHSGASILHLSTPISQLALEEGVDEATLDAFLQQARSTLLAARGRRVRPGRDEKVLASWNGMMLRALAEAAHPLDRPDLLDAARRTAAFLLTHMRAADGRLHRTWKSGHEARLNGYLEDYANVADGLLALYEATFERRWLDAAVALVDQVVERFADEEHGGFYDTASDHETLITRPKDVFDNATPAGSSVAADVLLRLALLLGRSDFQQQAQRALEPLREAFQRAPLGFGRALCAVDFLLGRPVEIAIVGSAGAADTSALVQTVFEAFLPNRVIAGSTSEEAGGGLDIPLLEQRGLRAGRATAYVCEGYTCQQPVTLPAELRQQLEAARPVPHQPDEQWVDV